MASTAPVLKVEPLSMMSRISSNCFIYRPPTEAKDVRSDSDRAPPSPKLILVCSWMAARDLHIAKYIVRHRAVHPTAQILLVRCEQADILNSSRAADAVQPAVPALRAVFGEEEAAAAAATGTGTTAASTTPELLVHVFSNGGSAMLSNIYKAYRPSTLPPHVTVFDSAPGQYSYSRSLTAMHAGLSPVQRVLLAPVHHAILLAYLFYNFVLPWRRHHGDPLARWAATHNDRAFNSTELRRAYIYSEEDKLIPFRDVEEHAAHAKTAGFDVRLEKFAGSPHVAHVRVDDKKYWRIVDEAWRGGRVWAVRSKRS